MVFTDICQVKLPPMNLLTQLTHIAVSTYSELILRNWAYLLANSYLTASDELISQSCNRKLLYSPCTVHTSGFDNNMHIAD